MRPPSRALVLFGLLLAGCAAAGPGGGEPGTAGPPAEVAPAGEPDLLVLTVVEPISDLARNVLGDRGQVRSLVDEGDAHTFEPTPQDAVLLGRADLFLANGLGLNDAAVRLAEANLPEGAPIVTLAELTLDDDDVIALEVPHAHNGQTHAHAREPNPHVWMNVAYAIDYVGHIADALVSVDPDGEDVYRRNAADYTAQLAALDAAIAQATTTIPPANRTLVAYHDSWAYYAPRYGLEHVEAVQPSDYSEPSAADVRTIVDEINARGVPAVFGAREFPSDVLSTIAAETGATYIGDLSDDSFPGQPGDPEHSYIGMMVANARAITEGLGGDASALDAVDPAAP
ncbi:MAG TPA: metal ABC transporter substrate-binding protein [Egibacteraceae bacterium]|nr:metal ABC transporter substrate-binding protein [Egibacteraceae bacterium]